MSNIDVFRSNLKKIVRPNRFLTRINAPAAFTAELGNCLADGDGIKLLAYHTKTAQIPARTIGEYAFKFCGMTLKMPGDTDYQELQLTIINTEDWMFRRFFENWQDMVIDAKNSSREYTNLLLLDAYIDVWQLGGLDNDGPSNDGTIMGYRFHSVYPKEVGNIELSMETGDTIEEFTVTFAYSHWTRDPDGEFEG